MEPGAINMFKISTKNIEFKKVIESKYLVYSHEEYKYVITDDKDLIEDDKINIVISLEKIDEISELISSIVNGDNLVISLRTPNGIKKVDVKDIEYFEALENDVFAVCGNNRYLCDDKLYVLEELLSKRYFVRTSKSFLVNILKINIIRPMLNYKFLLIMNNGDKIDVNRTYMKSFKEKLDL